ncbi:MAG: type II/IV secretion system ATPase subunit, partial [Methanoregula sp.]|nr:type II/IV secretion system ATPase subunit [Methanoregula sp.]
SIRNLPHILGDGTDQGDILILAVCIIVIVTGYTALLIDLPLVVLGILGAISLSALVLATSAVWYRFNPAIAKPRQPVPMRMISPQIAEYTRHSENVPCTRNTDVPLPEERTSGTLDTYWIEAPYVYIKIVRQGNLGFTYTVVEPAITAREQIVLRETAIHLRKVIVYDDPDKPPARQLSGEFIHHIIREFHPDITDDRLAILSYYLRRDLSGFGPLEALMHDPALEDISCNGDNLPVFVFHQTYGSLPTSVLFREGELNQFVLKLAQKANKQISLTNPMVDATLPGGSRVQVTYSNVVSLRGSSFTIRKFRTEPMTPLDLIRFGTYNAEILAFLWLVIEHRRSLIIAGGTASGKTTTMNAISLFIPQNAKIVSLEDTHEIQLPHSNWLATLTRELDTHGVQGDIDLFSLLKSSMRQRPEYIIVGEVRGKEAQTLFQAMNTGHATLSTIHAGSVQETINRLTHEPISVPPVMFTALDLVINQSMSTYGNSRIRRCLAIHEITVDGSTIIRRKLYEWDVCGDSFRKVASSSRVLEEIATMRGWTSEQVNEALKKREEFLTTALDVPTPDIRDLANAIHDLGE